MGKVKGSLFSLQLFKTQLEPETTVFPMELKISQLIQQLQPIVVVLDDERALGGAFRNPVLALC